MKPHSIGRTLGIGLRVAGRVVGQKVAAGSQAGLSAPAPSPPPLRAPATAAPVDSAARGRMAGQAAGQLAVPRAGGFGRGIAGFLKPFRRVGGILWLEVSGVFFLLFVAAFAPTLWKTRMSYAYGPDHRTFWSAAVIMVVFLYLSVSSFWRARKK